MDLDSVLSRIAKAGARVRNLKQNQGADTTANNSLLEAAVSELQALKQSNTAVLEAALWQRAEAGQTKEQLHTLLCALPTQRKRACEKELRRRRKIASTPATAPAPPTASASAPRPAATNADAAATTAAATSRATACQPPTDEDLARCCATLRALEASAKCEGGREEEEKTGAENL